MQNRRPSLAKAFRRDFGQFVRARRGIARVTAMFQKPQIAPQHTGLLTGCRISPAPVPRPPYRLQVPAGRGEFVGKEIQLVGQILGPGFGGKAQNPSPMPNSKRIFAAVG